MSVQPLAGLRVVVTRPLDQAAALVREIECRGADAVSVPVIEIVDPVDGGVSLRAALMTQQANDWLIITSPNGASRVAAALGDHSLTPGVRVAVIGPGTQAQAEAGGLPIDLVPVDSIAEGLLARFPVGTSVGSRVLLARAETARDVLPTELRRRGWTVDEVTAYRTVLVPVTASGRIACGRADAVVFTSGSTVRGLVDAVGIDGLPPIIVSIGPATSAVVTSVGATVSVEASVHSLPGVVDALVDHLHDRIVIHPEDAASADAQSCLERYFADIDSRFATGFDRTNVLTTDPHEVSPPHGLFLVVRLNGSPVGCGCLKLIEPGIADIKRMWLSPAVRGRGLGRRLLHHLVAEGQTLGLRQVRLDTNDALVEAIALYRGAGFVEVEAFNQEPNAHRWFILNY